VERWQKNGDQKARDRIVRSFFPLVIALARSRAKYGNNDSDDMISAALCGIAKCLDRYQIARGNRLMTYLRYYAFGYLEIQRSMDDTPLAGKPSWRTSKFYALKKEHDRIMASDNPEVEIVKLAKQWKLKPDLLKAALETLRTPESIDRRVDASDPGSCTYQDMLCSGDLTAEDAMIIAEQENDLESRVRDAVADLPSRERRIAEARLMDNSATLQDIGAEFAVSRERIRQLEKRTKSLLRESLCGMQPEMADAAE